MRKYPDTHDIKNRIITDGTAHLIFHAASMQDLIHAYSVPDYEYISGDLSAFLDRFRPLIPGKTPIVLEITGSHFDSKEKAIIDNALWVHYGLYLSEAAESLKKLLRRVLLFILLMILSSFFIILVSNIANEVITNYGYLLFWFFASRVLTILLLDCLPVYKEYQWYRQLASLKLIFSDDPDQLSDSRQVADEVSQYAREADRQIIGHRLVNHVFMEDSCVALGCCITQPEDILFPSGAKDIEIVSDELADYLTSALPFIKHEAITKLEIEGHSFTKEEQDRIATAIRNHLAFLIAGQDREKSDNTHTSILFTICLVAATLILYIWGKNVNIAVHEFFLVLFWSFADYLLELILLSRTKIQSQKKTLEKLANMNIVFKTK